MKRIVALLLAVILTGAFTFAAAAEAEIMPRASEYFSSYFHWHHAQGGRQAVRALQHDGRGNVFTAWDNYVSTSEKGGRRIPECWRGTVW